ncbi:MAG: LPS assembly protein LptD, partial [Pseudomonadota bacterium]
CGFAACLWLLSLPAWAQGPLACRQAETPQAQPFAAELPPGAVGVLAPELDLSQLGFSVFSGGVDVSQAGQRLQADQVSLDRQTNIASATGSVRYFSPELTIRAEQAELDLSGREVDIDLLDYWLGRGAGRGSADSAQRFGEARTDLEAVTFTTCPTGVSDWQISADRMSLDHEAGRGTARALTLRFKSVPLLYLPYAAFPLDDRRQSGFLLPAIGGSNDDGLDASIPYYFNLAPERDLTLTPRLITDRGPMLMGEYRYLGRRSQGELGFEVLPDDDRTGQRRSYSWLQHAGRLGDRWSLFVDLNHVSDDRYFEDLGNSLAANSRSFLRSLAQLSTAGRYWNASLAVDDYTSVDDTLAATAEPYSRLPRLNYQLDLPLGATRLEVDTELVAFDRDIGDEGWRLDLMPRLSRTFAGAAWMLEPSLSVRHTQYRLDSRAGDLDDSPSRTTPIAELDGRLFLERSGERYTQTLEPRFYLLYVPFEAQDEIPTFDTRDLTFSFGQLFRYNRFSGADRQGDASQLTLAVTTRLLDGGRDVLEASVGTIVHFRDRRVGLTGTATDDRDTSPLVGELTWRPSNNWRVVLGLQYEPEPLVGNDRLQQRQLSVRYRGAEGRLLNFAYRQRSQVVDQVDISAWWPLNERWAVLGRANYSFQDEALLEGLAGFEYQSCCWATRLMVRRFVRTLDGDYRNALYFELELKGLGSLGRGTGRVLEQAIAGYRYDNEPTAF